MKEIPNIFATVLSFCEYSATVQQMCSDFLEHIPIFHKYYLFSERVHLGLFEGPIRFLLAKREFCPSTLFVRGNVNNLEIRPKLRSRRRRRKKRARRRQATTSVRYSQFHFLQGAWRLKPFFWSAENVGCASFLNLIPTI